MGTGAMIDIETMNYELQNTRALFSEDELQLFSDLDLSYDLRDSTTDKYYTYWRRFGMDMPVPLRKHLLRELVKEVGI